MQKKISVIGSGHIGSTAALKILDKKLADVVLYDIVEGLPQGLALDLAESSPVEGFEHKVLGTNNFNDTANSDLFIITAGLTRKPGMTREDLLHKNADIMKGIVEKIKATSPNSIIIVVSNPLDIMAQLALKVSGFKSNRVIGMAGILDSARFRYFISEELKVSPSEVEAMVLGGHGDAMVPLPKYTKVSGKLLSDLLPEAKIMALAERTRNGGAEVVNLLKTGSAYFAPAASAVQMAESILLDKKSTLPCAAYLTGQYGLNDVYIGVPVKLGKNGIEEIIELDLTKEELAELKKSADIVKDNFNSLIR